VSDRLLDGDRIRAHLAEVAAALPTGRPQHRLILVGGSLLAWHGLRDSTRDVDSVAALDATLRHAVETVAARHGLAPRWLNDHARPFAPQTLREQDCDLLADLPSLLVLGAPLDQVFLMKLHATRVRTSDVEDMVALWPKTGFASASQAVALYYEAYPLAEEDPFLAAYVADLTGAPEHTEPAPG
jgi:hypothetical protein